MKGHICRIKEGTTCLPPRYCEIEQLQQNTGMGSYLPSTVLNNDLVVS
jgi:hypothetical protein